jgi:hypothetical protein
MPPLRPGCRPPGYRAALAPTRIPWRGAARPPAAPPGGRIFEQLASTGLTGHEKATHRTPEGDTPGMRARHTGIGNGHTELSPVVDGITHLE